MKGYCLNNPMLSNKLEGVCKSKVNEVVYKKPAYYNETKLSGVSCRQGSILINLLRS